MIEHGCNGVQLVDAVRELQSMVGDLRVRVDAIAHRPWGFVHAVDCNYTVSDDVNAKCTCSGIAPRAKYDPATQPGSPEFDGAEAYQAHLEAMYPDEAAPRADADTAGVSDEQLDKLFFWMCTNYKTEGLSGFKAKARDLFAADASNERADAAPNPSDKQEAVSRWDADNPLLPEIRQALNAEYKPLFPELQDTWPSPEDAALKACALMIKGICMTKPQDEWTALIEKRIQFMLKSAERADADQHVEAYQANQAREVFADSEKDAALTDAQIREIWLRETGFNEQAAPFAIIEFARAILAR